MFLCVFSASGLQPREAKGSGLRAPRGATQVGPVVPCARPFMTWGRGCPSPLPHGHSACRPSEDIRQAPRCFLSNALRTLKNETTALWGKVENVKDGGPSALSLRVHLVPPHVAWCASGGQTSGQELGAPPTRPRSVPPFPQAFQTTPSLLPPTVHEARPEHMASCCPRPSLGAGVRGGAAPGRPGEHTWSVV